MRIVDSRHHPVSVLPAALVASAAVLLFWVLNDLAGYLTLALGLAVAVWTDRRAWSRRLAPDLALIAGALTLISLISLHADISNAGMLRFTAALGGAVALPYAVSRWVYREHAITFPWGGGRWSRRQVAYLVVVVVAAYFLLPYYFLSSGVYRNWPAVESAEDIARLFVGVNAVGLWDELFFVCTCYVLFLRHFTAPVANLLQATIFVSFLWELGYQAWGPLLTVPFALIQALTFSWTKNLLYVVTVHLLFDAIVFLVIVHAHHPAALPIFPLVSG